MTKHRDKELIRRDLLEAAIESYTQGGTFSVRDIAGRAGVNHAQIQHLFGGKDGLTKAMFEHMGRSLLDRILTHDEESTEDMLKTAARVHLEDNGQFARALARHLIESPDAVAQDTFPVVTEALAKLSQFPEEQQNRLRRVMAERLALGLGWSLFSPWIRKAMNLEDDIAEELEAQLGEMPPTEES
jgi:AcrR family transcriptional regulator